MATYTPLQSVVLTSSATSVTISGISQDYTDLVLVARVQGTVEDNIFLRFNGDSSSLYSVTNLNGTGSAVSSNQFSSTFIWFDYSLYMRTSGFSTFIANINNYSNTSLNKSVLIRNNVTNIGVSASIGLYRSTSAVTSINISTTGFSAGSIFDLYGIKSGAPQALGGDTVTTDGNYWYHTFRSTGVFAPQRALTVDYLVVAGGGGGGGVGNGVNGGYPGAGGGGAGGYRTSIGNSTLTVAPQAYTVTVGAGGAGKYLTGGTGASGSNSVFSTITSAGGGGGASHGTGSGLSGGSGGGASTTVSSGGAGNTPSTSPSQGNNGGGYTTGDGGAGGGGASAVGGSVSSTSGGAGGAGSSNSISGSSVTYAGGGGGGSYSGGSGGAGGSGGGGAGGTYGSGGVANGTANLGGGGGGAGQISTTSGLTGGNGGSGIVIVRYPV